MINPLTSFRFLAALLVFLHHVGVWKNYQPGYIGVTFFFILSGFILCLNYKERLCKVDLNEIRKYYIARFAKIYPTHLLTFFLAIPYYFFIQLEHSPILYTLQAFTNILLLHSFIPFGNISFNGPSWSISVEFFFYAIFPFMIYKVLKYLKGRRKKLVTISLCWLVVMIFALLFSLFKNFPINTRWLFYFFPLTRTLEFFIGVLLGLLFLEVKQVYSKRSNGIFTAFELFSLILLLIIAFYSPNVHQNLRYGLIYSPFLSLIIFVFAFQRGFISSVLSNKLLIYLGEISFSFYMIHNLVLSYTYWSILKLNINVITITGCFLITVILSSLVYHFYEEPMRRKIRGKFADRSLFFFGNTNFKIRGICQQVISRYLIRRGI